MNINLTVNPPSFTFDRSFFEVGCKMGDEDRLRFYDSLCEVAFTDTCPTAPRATPRSPWP